MMGDAVYLMAGEGIFLCWAKLKTKKLYRPLVVVCSPSIEILPLSHDRWVTSQLKTQNTHQIMFCKDDFGI